MIGFCPLDDQPEVIPRPQTTRAVPRVIAKPIGKEATECNYLILFFILGVLALSVSDRIMFVQF
jgi:hypothetical protein